MKVLASPAGYELSDRFGSDEGYWTYKIIDSLAREMMSLRCTWQINFLVNDQWE